MHRRDASLYSLDDSRIFLSLAAHNPTAWMNGMLELRVAGEKHAAWFLIGFR
jgi:hypothetical protein